MTHHFAANESNKHLITAIENESRFGILSYKRLPAIADFPLYMHQGKITVSIRYSRSGLFMNSHDLNLLRNFHVMLFQDVLNMFTWFMSNDYTNEENSFMLVPLVNSTYINWDIVQRFQKLPPVCIQSTNEKMRKPYIAREWLGSVVSKLYRDTDTKFIVVKVHEDKTPLTQFPDETFKSYKQYFDSINQPVERTDTFLIEVRAITSDFKFIDQKMVRTSAKKNADREIILLPELCNNTNFPAHLWVKCMMLPNILYRINSILVAEKIRTSLNDFVGILNDYSPSRVDFGHVNSSSDKSENKKSGEYNFFNCLNFIDKFELNFFF